jgi:peroxiredoxin
MALLESMNIPLGSPMPEFSLPDPDGVTYNGKELTGENGLLVAFTCNHCPYAIAVWPRLVELAKLGKTLGIATAAINPNINPNYPEDAPDKMKIKTQEWGIFFPYLIDESQATAKAFKAQCTPDLYLFDKDQKLAYHGRIDDNWEDATKVTRHELKEALEALGSGQAVPTEQRPSMGCSIKWK